MIEALAAESWKELVQPKKPDRTWALICEKEPDIAEAHKKAIRCHCESDFDLDKGLLAITDGKVRRADWLDSNVKFHQSLIEFIKKWLRANV